MERQNKNDAAGFKEILAECPACIKAGSLRETADMVVLDLKKVVTSLFEGICGKNA
jgi:hypothetical protein